MKKLIWQSKFYVDIINKKGLEIGLLLYWWPPLQIVAKFSKTAESERIVELAELAEDAGLGIFLKSGVPPKWLYQSSSLDLASSNCQSD